MTELAIHQPNAVAVPDQAAAPGTDLVLWARQAEAAAIYAERVCSTTMAPSAYRGKPAEAAAAILAGAELGFSPMASLRAFDNISGTPAPKAMTLRAVVQAAGHEVRIVESTDERAVVDGRRKGDTEWQTSIWDIPRAQKLAQYKTNAMYKTNIAQMLCARATAEVCRWIGADAIMGMPYAAEEIGDFEPAVPAPAARRLTVAELDAAPTEVPDSAHTEMIDDKQRRHMFALWAELGFDNNSDADRATRLDVISRFIGERVESSSDLTRADADLVIAKLIERRDARNVAS